MAPPHRVNSPQKEGRIALAIHSLQKKQLKSQRSAAKTYVVPRRTLQRREKGIPPRRGSKAKNRLLLEYEEAELIKWICSMERRGFPPCLIDVNRMCQHVGPNSHRPLGSALFFGPRCKVFGSHYLVSCASQNG